MNEFVMEILKQSPGLAAPLLGMVLGLFFWKSYKSEKRKDVALRQSLKDKSTTSIKLNGLRIKKTLKKKK